MNLFDFGSLTDPEELPNDAQLFLIPACPPSLQALPPESVELKQIATSTCRPSNSTLLIKASADSWLTAVRSAKSARHYACSCKATLHSHWKS
eukprot:992397-Pelagomonas_calceolata.AAC.1